MCARARPRAHALDHTRLHSAHIEQECGRARRASMCSRTPTWRHVSVCARARTHRRARVCVCARVGARAHTHDHTHTRVLTHSHTIKHMAARRARTPLAMRSHNAVRRALWAAPRCAHWHARATVRRWDGLGGRVCVRGGAATHTNHETTICERRLRTHVSGARVRRRMTCAEACCLSSGCSRGWAPASRRGTQLRGVTSVRRAHR